MTKLRNAIIGCVLFGLASTAVAADDYKIVLYRPYKVGDKFSIEETIKFKISQKAGANERGDEFSAEMKGVVTVVAVTDEDKGSQPTKYTCKVSKCAKDGQDMMEAGTVVTAENVDGHTKVTVDGKEVDDEFRAAVSELFDTADPKDPSDDKTIGTKERQSVGGSWKIDGDFVAKKLAEEKIPFQEGDIKGKAKLVSVDEVDGKEMATIETSCKGAVDEREVDQQGTFKDLKFTLKDTATMSADGKGHGGTDSVVTSLKFTVSSDQGSAQVSTSHERTITIKPVK